MLSQTPLLGKALATNFAGMENAPFTFSHNSVYLWSRLNSETLDAVFGGSHRRHNAQHLYPRQSHVDIDAQVC